MVVRRKTRPSASRSNTRPRTGEGSGGRREGAGRKKGSLKQRSRDVLHSALAPEAGITPLEHILSVMRTPEPPAKADPKVKLAWRAQSLDAAKAAAPYCHPRLTAAVNPNNPDKPPEQDVNINVRFVTPNEKKDQS